MIRIALPLLLLAVVFASGSSAAWGGTPFDGQVAPAAYGELLARHVVVLESENDAIETRFDYAAFAAREDQAEVRRSLRETFLSVEPHALGEAARTAWAANTYNFLVIDRVVQAWVTRGGELNSVAEVGAGDFAMFDAEDIVLGEESLSLNQFEHRFLFLDIDRESGEVPEGLDPRLHFAIVCAARGCPPLWTEPFQAGRLDEQLNAVTAAALAGPRHLRIEGSIIHISALFEWYAADFQPGGVLEFLAHHAPAVAALMTEDDPRVVADIEWDWALNTP